MTINITKATQDAITAYNSQHGTDIKLYRDSIYTDMLGGRPYDVPSVELQDEQGQGFFYLVNDHGELILYCHDMGLTPLPHVITTSTQLRNTVKACLKDWDND